MNAKKSSDTASLKLGLECMHIILGTVVTGRKFRKKTEENNNFMHVM